jgi:hypothetical protein
VELAAYPQIGGMKFLKWASTVYQNAFKVYKSVDRPNAEQFKRRSFCLFHSMEDIVPLPMDVLWFDGRHGPIEQRLKDAIAQP